MQQHMVNNRRIRYIYVEDITDYRSFSILIWPYQSDVLPCFLFIVKRSWWLASFDYPQCSALLHGYWDNLMIDPKSLYPDSKVHGANMGPIWGRQDPGGPHVGPINFAIWVVTRGLHSLKRHRLTGIGIPIINLRRSDDRTGFITRIPIPIKRCILSDQKPW